MNEDVVAERFQLKRLSAVTGVSQQKIGDWLLRGRWTFPTRGIGKSRNYGFWDAVMATLIRELIAVGVSNYKNADLGNRIAWCLFNHVQGSARNGEFQRIDTVTLMIIGHSVSVITTPPAAIAGSHCIALDLRRPLRTTVDRLRFRD